ncbi:MAG: pentapeptide repeat-containing protein [Alphaproteobacteria bacterium]|nr:pentapeptide repeat-containing protein [Alphaproteobacteria bacterium]
MVSIIPETITTLRTETVSFCNNRYGGFCYLSEAQTESGETITLVTGIDLRDSLYSMSQNFCGSNAMQFCQMFLWSLSRTVNHIYFHDFIIGTDEQYKQHKEDMPKSNNKLIDINEETFWYLLSSFNIECNNVNFLIKIVPPTFQNLHERLSNNPYSLRCNNVDFYDNVDFSNKAFIGEAVFQNTRFRKKANFSNTRFMENAYFFDAKFYDKVCFSNGTFDADVAFSDSRFEKETDFFCSTFAKKGAFCNTIFTEKANFSNAKFDHECNFSGTKFNGGKDFYNTVFHKNAGCQV